MTTRPRLYKTEGLVLKSTPVGEADRLVTLYTRDRGRLRASARGVRRVTSRLGGHLDVLNRVSLALARGRSRDVITGAEALETFRPLKADLERLAYGLYVAELVDAMTPEEASSYPIYALALDSLRLLETPGNPRPVLHAFELRLLDLSGFLPELRVCVQCRKDLLPGQHRYAPEAGGVVCSNCFTTRGPVMPLSVNGLKALRFLAASGLADAPRLRLPTGVDGEVTALLAGSIRHVLETEVRSAALIEHLHQLRQGEAPEANRPAATP